jgi:hypothetical protein
VAIRSSPLHFSFSGSGGIPGSAARGRVETNGIASPTASTVRRHNGRIAMGLEFQEVGAELRMAILGTD